MNARASTHYEVLGVPRDADRETIRRAYVAVARVAHPDRQSAEPVSREAAEDRIRAANAAWHVLGDPDRRREYDRSLPDQIGARGTDATPPTGSSDLRPPPPSGVMVPASTAALWKWGPIVLAVVIGAAILIGSAYATTRDPASSSSPTTTRSQPFAKGDCVVVTAGPSGRLAQRVPCEQEFASIIDSVTDTPRPCPSTTAGIPLSDGRTTLCLQFRSAPVPSGS